MKSMKKVPCAQNCTDRTAGCHASCIKYKEWRAEYDKGKAEKKAAKMKSELMEDVEVSRRERLDRRKRRKPKER